MSLLPFVPYEMEKLGECKHTENEPNDQADEEEYLNGGEKRHALIHQEILGWKYPLRKTEYHHHDSIENSEEKQPVDLREYWHLETICAEIWNQRYHHCVSSKKETNYVPIETEGGTLLKVGDKVVGECGE